MSLFHAHALFWPHQAHPCLRKRSVACGWLTISEELKSVTSSPRTLFSLDKVVEAVANSKDRQAEQTLGGVPFPSSSGSSVDNPRRSGTHPTAAAAAKH